jgi:hypothetical protein
VSAEIAGSRVRGQHNCCHASVLRCMRPPSQVAGYVTTSTHHCCCCSSQQLRSRPEGAVWKNCYITVTILPHARFVGRSPGPLQLFVSNSSELCGASWSLLKHAAVGPGAGSGFDSSPAFVLTYTFGGPEQVSAGPMDFTLPTGQRVSSVISSPVFVVACGCMWPLQVLATWDWHGNGQCEVSLQVFVPAVLYVCCII